MESALNWHAAIPELALACLGMAALMLGVFMRRGATLAVTMFTLASLLLVAMLVLAADAPVVAFDGLFVLDAFAVFTKVLVLLSPRSHSSSRSTGTRRRGSIASSIRSWCCLRPSV